MFIIPFWYGLFYEYSAFIAGIIFLILFCKIAIQNKKIIIKNSKNFYIYIILIFSYLVTALWAIDKEMAIEGFLKFLTGIFYFILLMQFEKEEKQKILNTIPLSGAIMCLISYVLGQIPALKAHFFSGNGRLVGFFQYSNSFALFMLIGIIIIFNKKQKDLKDKITLGILALGILITGSRFTFILTVLYLFYQILKHRKNKKKILIGVLLAISVLVASIILLQITGSIDIFERLFKISLEESSVMGRLIYYLDGIKIIAKYPFGLRLYGI